ncbi:MAG: 50S ribosomal protein L25 [Acidobacteriota bacterium]|jgi:large subunit ribosomal protein L25|nr:50S ribosomal protein L25 [Acidobacteriota bacterium]
MPTVIEAQLRTPGGKNANNRLRKAGKIPAVIYGPGKQPVVVSVNPQDVKTILHSESGRNTIFGISVDGVGQNNAMVKDYQLDPVHGNLIHADFLEIAMDRLLILTVNVEIVGEAEGVKLDGGIMDIVTRSIEVECLPSDIPESIKVDVSKLKINDYVRVKNLQVDEKVKVLSDPEIVVVTIVPPTKEEAPAEAAAAETAEPEVIKKGKTAEEGAEEEKSKK